ncbi:MAG: MerR family transcriptional regulator [Clostridia bacterium]|nr:MerR family transcriptional regulator [Clostridia bacterium]
MELKIHEAAELAGVSVRTLHYYDQIGLLPPGRTTQAGYRLYDDAAMERLQEILFYRELGFALGDIRLILSDPGYDRREALLRQHEMMCRKRERLDGLIDLLERTLRGERDMSFTQFDTKEMDAMKKEYAQEARSRWGGTQAYAEHEKKTAGYDKAKWNDVEEGMNALMAQFAALRGESPAGSAAQALVAQWQAYLSANFYTCTDELLAGLGQMYAADERFRQNIDAHGEGTAQFMADAIAAYCGK